MKRFPGGERETARCRFISPKMGNEQAEGLAREERLLENKRADLSFFLDRFVSSAFFFFWLAGKRQECEEQGRLALCREWVVHCAVGSEISAAAAQRTERIPFSVYTRRLRKTKQRRYLAYHPVAGIVSEERSKSKS